MYRDRAYGGDYRPPQYTWTSAQRAKMSAALRRLLTRASIESYERQWRQRMEASGREPNLPPWAPGMDSSLGTGPRITRPYVDPDSGMGVLVPYPAPED